MDIKYYFEETQLTYVQIAKRTGLSYKQVHSRITRMFPKRARDARKKLNYSLSKRGDKNPMLGVTREQHPRYKGVVSDSKGYLLVVKPDWYTGRKGSHHIFQHSLVVCVSEYLSCIPAGHCVHHCDRNPQNNDYSNLILLSLAEHSALHRALGSATTISKESTAKWLEARRAGNSYDIV